MCRALDNTNPFFAFPHVLRTFAYTNFEPFAWKNALVTSATISRSPLLHAAKLDNTNLHEQRYLSLLGLY